MVFIQELCDKAMNDLENTEPPLFLRFTNLLINDAHFLLDEALDVSVSVHICCIYILVCGWLGHTA